MKTCARCKMAIDIKQERYVKIEDNHGTQNMSKLFYHRECWSEIMTGKAALHNLNKEALDLMSGIRGMMNIDKEVTL